jgi:hypothetical protein
VIGRQRPAVSRIRLSDKTSRLHPRHVVPKRGSSVLRKDFTSNGGFLFFALANNVSHPLFRCGGHFTAGPPGAQVFVERHVGGNCSPLNRGVLKAVKSGTDHIGWPGLRGSSDCKTASAREFSDEIDGAPPSGSNLREKTPGPGFQSDTERAMAPYDFSACCVFA